MLRVTGHFVLDRTVFWPYPFSKVPEQAAKELLFCVQG
jgi:hypothetical protein